jgi:hypothetical protein
MPSASVATRKVSPNRRIERTIPGPSTVESESTNDLSILRMSMGRRRRYDSDE